MGAFAVLLAFAVTVLWLNIGWRAMRAHEELASAVQRIADSRHIEPDQARVIFDQAPMSARSARRHGPV